MNNILFYLICAAVGIASLNFLNNYNSPFEYIPGDGTTVATTSRPRLPGDGTTVATTSHPRLPGDGTTVSSMSDPRPPGGMDYSIIAYMTGLNWLAFIMSIIGGMLGGFIYKRCLPNQTNLLDNYILPSLIMAFIFSRALLFSIYLLIDLIRWLIA